MNSRELYPDLFYFLGNYFIPGYDIGMSTAEWKHIVDDFLAVESLETVASTVYDLERLLALQSNERQLESILDELGCYFSFVHVPMTRGEWLMQVKEHLSARLEP